jgi:hypothetical protein
MIPGASSPESRIKPVKRLFPPVGFAELSLTMRSDYRENAPRDLALLCVEFYAVSFAFI